MTKFDTILFTIFLFLVPIFGKSLDSIESIIFYIIPIVFSIGLIFSKNKLQFSNKTIILQLLLISLLLINLFFSQAINFSYYHFFSILCVLLISNIAIQHINQKDFLKYLLIFSFIYSFIFLLNKIGLIHLAPKAMGDNFIKQYWGHSYLSDILIISIPLLIYQRANPLIILFQIIILILTNSRSSLFILPFIIILIPKINLKQKIIYIVSTALAFVLFIFLIKFNYITSKNIIGNRFDYWSQAITAFKNHPIIGSGQNTFFLTSNIYRQNMNQSSYAHNSLLTLFSDYGIIISLFIIYFVYKQFKYQLKNNFIFFLLSISILTNSFFDTTLNSYGILIILIYFLFKKDNSKIIIKSKYSSLFIFFISSLLIFHSFSKIFSDYLFYSKNKYDLSLRVDPFNVNAYLKNIDQDNISPIFINNESVYKQIIDDNQLPGNEKFYYNLFSLNPKDYHEYYQRLAQYYLDNKLFDKLDLLSQTIDKNFNNEDMNEVASLLISRIFYQASLDQIDTNPQRSIKYLQLNIKLNPKLSYYYIELANSYDYTNQKELAKKEIEKCVNIPQSNSHCLDFQTKNIFSKPGTTDIKDTILNYLGILK